MSRNYRTKAISPMDFVPYVTMLLLLGFFLMIAAHVTAPVHEGDAGFNCFAHGNHICGEPASEATAWQAWDAKDGAASLDPAKASRVEYVGVAVIKPLLSSHEIAVSWEDGRWYVFRAEYI